MAHDHRHGGWRYSVAAAIQTAFVVVEALCGFIFFPNPALVADAGHNSSDIAFALFGGAIEKLTHGRSHRIRHHLPRYVGIGMCFATIVVIGGVVSWEAFKVPNTSAEALGFTALLGGMGWLVNFGVGVFMSRGADAMARATAQHFKSDAKVSLLLIAIATAAHWYPRPAMIGGAIIITIWTAWDNLHLARDIRRELLDCRAQDANPNQMEMPFERSH